MGFFKNLFKRKEKKKEPEKVIIPEGAIICDYCEDFILSHEKRTKIKGKRFHKKCYKKLKKETLKKVYG